MEYNPSRLPLFIIGARLAFPITATAGRAAIVRGPAAVRRLMWPLWPRNRDTAR
jgi:hypothetical protein